MAINFPDSPSNGAVYTYAGKTFIYDTSKSKWTISNISLESVSSDILPDVDSSRNLGSSTKKWKDLYLSGNTLFLGDSGSISSGAGGEISLPSIKIGTGSDAVKLQATGGTLKTENATSGTENAKSGTTTVANLTAMQTLASPIQGDIVNVTANNTIYMYTGTGWFKIATVSNESPTAITGVNSSYGLATDGTPTIIDVVSTDPEGATLIYNYSVISGSLTNGGGTTATVAQGSGANTNRFTITPTQTSGYGGNFNLRFTATDNINVVNSDASFTLSFTPQQIGSDTIYTTGSGTYSIPSGANYVRVYVTGGGGGGGGASGSSGYWFNSGGAGAGGTIIGVLAVTSGQSITYTVGAAGTGGVGTNSGTDGGTSSLNYNSTDFAIGVGGDGSGGGGYSGAGGAANHTGMVSVSQNPGGAGASGSYGNFANTGAGGASYYGAGGSKGNYIYSGNGGSATSTHYGAGGGGAGSNSGNATGGAGAEGYIVIQAWTMTPP